MNTRIIILCATLWALSGCSQPHTLDFDWRITGAPDIAKKLERALQKPLREDQKPLYHIHLEEKVSLERLDPLDLKTLHTAYQLTDRIILSWDPTPKHRNQSNAFEQSIILDIPPSQSIQTTPQVRHAKQRLREHLANDILAYLR